MSISVEASEASEAGGEVSPPSQDIHRMLETARRAAQVSFEAYVAGNARRRYLVAGLFVPIGVPIFALTDLLLYPGKLKLLFKIRLVIAVIGALTWWSTYLSRSYWQVMVASSVGSALELWGMSWLGYAAEGYQSPYFAAVGLLLAGIACFVEWPFPLCLGVVGSVFLVHFAPAVVVGLPANAPRFVFESALVVTFGLVAIAAVRVRVDLSRQDYEAKRALGRSYLMLDEVNRTKDQLFQNISHEFRTPLALILAPVESLLEASDAGAPQRQKLTTVRDNALRLLNLINDLLDLAKLDAVGLQAAAVPLELGSFVKGLAEQAHFLAERQGLALQVRNVEQPAWYVLDPKFLEKVLLNLLSNAFKFTPRGGRVTLEVREGADGLRLEVQDTGCGIPAEARQRIFERFRQVDGTSTRQHGGTGIGLALVKELSELMGGTVEVQSEVNRGSTFSLHFPARLRAEPAASQAPSAPPVTAVEPAMSGLSRRAALTVLNIKEGGDEVLRRGASGPKVLLAEDDRELRASIVELLEGSYQVIAAPNGKVALDLAIASPPDVIVSDVMMPVMDGLMLTSKVRQHPRLRQVPIILLTARAEVSQRVEGRKLGVDTYLTKPYEPRELQAAVEGLLRARMKLVGDYYLGELLGVGGQSKVYRAVHRSTGAPVALKLLAGELLAETDLVRLRREGAALQRLTHPNIVRTLDQGFDEEHGYLVMHLLEGQSLRALVAQQGCLPPNAAVGVAIALADALEAVHAAGLVHRDIKGDNVILVRGAPTLAEQVRRIDFGIVREAQLKTLSETNTVVGTLPFLAPELLGGQEPTPASDVYALGVLLYFMCSGMLPFHGPNRSSTQQAILAGVPPVIPAAGREPLPEGLHAILVAALAPLGRRYASAAQLRDALRGLGLTAAAPLSLPTPGSSNADLVSTAVLAAKRPT